MIDREKLNEHLFRIKVATVEDWDEVLYDFLVRAYPTLEAQVN